MEALFCSEWDRIPAPSPAQLVASGQMFTGLPLNHSWIADTVLLAAGGAKDATRNSWMNGMADGQSSTINMSMNGKVMRNIQRNRFLFSMSKIGNQDTNSCGV